MKQFNGITKPLVIVSLLMLTLPALALNFSGKTQWSNPIELSSIVKASVKQYFVTEGQPIKKGEELILMDSTLLLLDYKLAETNLLALAPIKSLAEMDMNRAFELYDRELLTEVALKTAESKYAQISAEFNVAQAAKDKAEVLLKATKIDSPINGRVISINRSVGYFSDIEHSVSLMTIADDSKMNAIAYVKVSQWNYNLVGKRATVIINNKRHSGMVKSLSFVPIENSKGLSVYPIVVSFQPKAILPAGMPVTIEIK